MWFSFRLCDTVAGSGGSGSSAVRSAVAYRGVS